MDKPIKLTSYMKVRLSFLITSHYISQHQENCARLTHEIRKATFNIKACTVSHTHP